MLLPKKKERLSFSFLFSLYIYIYSFIFCFSFFYFIIFSLYIYYFVFCYAHFLVVFVFIDFFLNQRTITTTINIYKFSFISLFVSDTHRHTHKYTHSLIHRSSTCSHVDKHNKHILLLNYFILFVVMFVVVFRFFSFIFLVQWKIGGLFFLLFSLHNYSLIFVLFVINLYFCSHF